MEQIEVRTVCNKCFGKGRLSDKKGSKADHSYGYIDTCFECNGRGSIAIKHYGLPPDAGQRRM